MSDSGRNLDIPMLSLVLLVGASGSGKSTFAARHFLPTEIVSSDACRGIVADDENDLAATPDAFALVDFIVATRLRAGRLTVVDATSVRREDRAKLIAIARQHHVLSVAIVFNLPERLCQDRNQSRPDRNFGPHVVRNHTRELRRGLRGMRREGFSNVHVLESPDEIDGATITRTRLWNDKCDHHGPFDIIGDIHGCADELEVLLAHLGYQFGDESKAYGHPAGRAAVFLGDLVDRGPRVLDTVEIIRRMVAADVNSARTCPGLGRRTIPAAMPIATGVVPFRGAWRAQRNVNTTRARTANDTGEATPARVRWGRGGFRRPTSRSRRGCARRASS